MIFSALIQLSASQITAYIPDLVLILISGAACLYCALLNRRLKGLNDLKSGVGASIVSLTDAIKQTHQAAQETQSSTLQTVETLRHLLEKAEKTTPKVKLLISELTQITHTADIGRKDLDAILSEGLPAATNKAQTTAKDLLNILTQLEAYQKSLTKNTASNLVDMTAQREARAQMKKAAI